MSRTKRKKKTELEVYHRNEKSRFMTLIEKTDYQRDDKTRLYIEKDFIIKNNGEVFIFNIYKDYNVDGSIKNEQHHLLDKFILPVNHIQSLKKSKDYKQHFHAPAGTFYTCFNNDINYTKCIIKIHTGFKNNPVFKIVNDYDNRYAFLLSYFIKPFTKLTVKQLSNLSFVRDNIR